MIDNYIRELYHDDLNRYISLGETKRIKDETWLKSNRYIKIAGISSKYYKTTKFFRDNYTRYKGISCVINSLSTTEYMVTLFNSDMELLMRFKQDKESINKNF